MCACKYVHACMCERACVHTHAERERERESDREREWGGGRSVSVCKCATVCVCACMSVRACVYVFVCDRYPPLVTYQAPPKEQISFSCNKRRTRKFRSILCRGMVRGGFHPNESQSNVFSLCRPSRTTTLTIIRSGFCCCCWFKKTKQNGLHKTQSLLWKDKN